MNKIKLFFHCAKCLDELPPKTSPSEWARIAVGWTKKGFQIWCVRHDINIMNYDLKGQKVEEIL